MKQAQLNAGPRKGGLTSDEHAEMARLRKRVKQRGGTHGKAWDRRTIFGFMKAYQATYPIGVMGRVLDSRKAAKHAGIRLSMGSIGDGYDNAMCESFNATLECELLVKHRFRTQRDAEAAVFDFIEAWYTPHRRHAALDYLSPIDFERRAKAAA